MVLLTRIPSLLALFLTGLILSVGLALLYLDSVRPSPQMTVSLVSAQMPADTFEDVRAKLRVAVAAIVSPGDSFLTYRKLVDYLAAQVGRRSELVLRPTYEQVNELVEGGLVDVAFICSGAYAAAAPRGAIELLVAPIVDGGTVYYADIIVPDSSAAHTLEDLRGGRFGYVDELSNSGRTAPRAYLQQLGYNPDRFFAETVLTHSHDRSIAAVSRGLIDGASVDSLILEAMLDRQDPRAAGVRVIDRLGPYGMPPVVVPTGIDPALKEQLRQVFLDIALNPSGKALLQPLRIDGFRVPSAAEYEGVGTVATGSTPEQAAREP
ncbi:MAG: phosphate/phosphite/phosphonate ABC transporter substrate-binding protein [Thermoleophilia bacterium]|nr:phosphate/phosphite/phosphonate ABC transporter substrate-binding protein [Thermoleophilia bacterium]